MTLTPAVRFTGYWIAALLILMAFRPVNAHASELELRVTDRASGHPLQEVVVTLMPESPVARQQGVPTTYVMSQKQQQFVPQVLVIARGDKVNFPNRDTIRHHVYSFARGNSFELKLYLDEPRPPVTFEHTGLVTVGCNIHDQMRGYIVVTDAPWFAMTDREGRITLSDLPEGKYTLTLWHEQLAANKQTSQSMPMVVQGARQHEDIALTLASTAPALPEPSALQQRFNRAFDQAGESR
ncbi:methylamine utilization protein [Larsenimonas rhizosphaerae]|uniref:Methylamine utilization protein n=1 Tax=Larsenimonas rhizosphaerae TaxID=2944682 RepID=A0AA42CST7_9GAMM|nr:methylamine utilization protein [Larsenimonas rhizosphaerae]MCM2130205.1 methylamine utilization protein [Larsenimonas rhizosphaerae]MCX2522892.1 methylamine utilization protein [Larsenimonas rhizosphaerae]